MKVLQCPHCRYRGKSQGQYGTGFRHVEDAAISRDVIGFNAYGALVIESLINDTDLDSASNERLECMNCLKEFSLPKVEIEWR